MEQVRRLRFDMKKKQNKKSVARAVAFLLTIVTVAIAVAVILVTVNDDSRQFSVEFAVRGTVYTPRETKVKTVTTVHLRGDAPETTDESPETSAVPTGMNKGAFHCRMDMTKTAWEADEVPKFTLNFGLSDQSYGAGKLVLHIVCDDMKLSDELEISDYIYDLHAIDGKTMPDTAEFSLIRTDSEADFAFGRLYLYFEFIPDVGNTAFGDEWADTYYDEYDPDDMEPGDEDDLLGDIFRRHGLWIGGYSCAYAITPSGVRFARRDVAADDFFADTAVMQYKKGELTADELCDAYWNYALSGGVYISATSPILNGETTLTYISSDLRAVTRYAVSDAEVLKMVSENGPYYDEPNENATVERAAGRNLALAILAELCEEGVITDAEYDAEVEYATAAQNYITAPPEIDRGFKRYRNLIEENLITHK